MKIKTVRIELELVTETGLQISGLQYFDGEGALIKIGQYVGSAITEIEKMPAAPSEKTND